MNVFRLVRGSLALLLVAGFGAASCKRGSAASSADSGASASTSTTPSASASAAPSASTSTSASADGGVVLPPARTEGCPDGMVRVDGEYCPVVIEDCLEEHEEYKLHKDNKNVSERCLHYKKPTRCFVKDKKHLSFCMDRFEWPNEIGELPRILTSWTQAKAFCEKAGKRLCTEDEFNFACEGPEMLPYAYGYDRDPTKCNIDRDYVMPDHTRRLYYYDRCLKSDWCSAEIKRLDQRHAIGSRMTCVSWSGVVDINGNVNEWVELPGEKPPNRSGLKGGWWGPVRSRCRPTVTFHKEDDYGYEVGFRCCKDAERTSDAGSADASP